MSEGSLEQRVEAARERAAWRQSPAYKKSWRNGLLWIGVGIITGSIPFVFYIISISNGPIPASETVFYCASTVLLILSCSCIGLALNYDKFQEFRDAQLLERYGDLVGRQGQLLSEDRLKLGELWQLSEERLRVYHEIATRQAKASFRNAQWAIVAGFFVIIVGSCVVFLAKNVTTAIVIGTLGAVGAALSAYIGRTFLRLQETAAAHLRSYFDQPREQFRYLAAERLLSHLDSDEQKAAAINELMRSIASSPDHGKGFHPS